MDTLSLIRASLNERLGVQPDTVVREAALASLGVDSLQLLELIFELEERLRIPLPKDALTPKTVGELVDFIDHLRRTLSAA